MQGEGGDAALREERSGVGGEEEATRGEGHVSGVQEKQSEAVSKTEKWIRGERGDLTTSGSGEDG